MRVCLVTGGSGGIGAAIVRRMSTASHVVYVNYRRSETAARALCAEICAAGNVAHPVQADVASRPDVQRLMERIRTDHGRLDVLVHNAARPLVLKPVTKLDWENDVLPQIQVACLGFLNCVQEAAPLLSAGARIVVLLTDALFHKPPVQMGSAYLAAKGALLGLARAVAKEFERKQISLSMVSPGMTQTNLLEQYGDRALELFAQDHRLGRLAEPDEVAEAVAFLACSPSPYIHGVNLFVNGGHEF